jgi:taurine dioxygenase
MKVSAFSKGCGAIVSNLQLSGMSDQELSDLRGAFTDHGLLFFRDQQLSLEDHLSFANRFGDIVLNKFFKPVEGQPQIAEVRKEKSQEMNIGGGWHTDHSYDEEPAMGSILVARELPASGGDTHFANLYAAYEALSPGLQKTLESMRAIHSNVHIYGENGFYRTTDLAEQLGGIDRVGDATHPVVIKHPESGRKVLYVNPGHTIGFEGWSREESFALLEYLYKHVDQPEFTCQFNWQPGSVAFWDNRCTWHFAQNDYQGQSRLMHRITLAGSALSGA